MNRPRSTQSQRGFTLLEVLVAIMVLSIGLLGLANLQSVGTRLGHEAELRNRAAFLANEGLDLIRSHLADPQSGRVTELTAFEFELGATQLPSTVTTAAAFIDPWLTRVGLDLPNGEAGIVIDPTTSQVTITIRWRERGDQKVEKGEVEKDETQRFTLISRMRT